MCDTVKDIEFVRKQYEIAKILRIDIIEIEFISGKTQLRDRWSIENILYRIDKIKREHEQPQSDVPKVQV